MFLMLFVFLTICLSVWLRKNDLTNIDETFSGGQSMGQQRTNSFFWQILDLCFHFL